MQQDLHIVATEDNSPTIILSGDVDFHNARKIREAVERLFSRRDFDVTIDVSNLQFIDSSGLSALLDAARQAKANDGVIRLQEPSHQLIHVLTIAGFAPFFSIASKGGDACEHEDREATDAPTQWQVTQFQIPPRTELVAQLRNRVAAIAGKLPFSKQEIEDIKLAVGEASSNALRYGCPKDDDIISVRCCSNHSSLRVQIKDCGRGFNPEAVAPPDDTMLEEGGRGIYLMRLLMDEVKFHFSSTGTMVELVKRIR